MRVVFLDFDGVVICPPNFRKPCPDRIGLLNRLLKATGAVVVVSSTWRIGRPVGELQRMLCEAGFTGEVVGKTPVIEALPNSPLWPGTERGVEVQAWLSIHRVDSYVVLDDDSHRGPIPEDRWILTKFDEGLTEHAIGEANWALRRPLGRDEIRRIPPAGVLEVDA